MKATQIEEQDGAGARCELVLADSSGPGDSSVQADSSKRRQVLRLVLGGRWHLGSALPALDELRECLAAGGVERVELCGAELGEWDTGLLIWVTRVRDLCAACEVEFVRDELPAGALRLAALAEAVPERVESRRDGAGPGTWARLTHLGHDRALEAGRQVRFLGELTLALGRFLRGGPRFRAVDFWQLVLECGAQALPIVSICALLIGLVLAFVGAVQLHQFGAEIYVADLVGLGMTREMGALITGIVMAGRTGAGFAAYLGTMQAGEEIDALRTLGVDPVDFLVVPRVLALLLMLPILTIYAMALGIVGGGVVGTQLLDIPSAQYVTQMASSVGLDDIWVGIVKSIAFALIVAYTGCLRGIQAGRSSAGVGQAATSAVVTGILYIIIADALFTVIFEALGV